MVDLGPDVGLIAATSPSSPLSAPTTPAKCQKLLPEALMQGCDVDHLLPCRHIHDRPGPFRLLPELTQHRNQDQGSDETCHQQHRQDADCHCYEQSRCQHLAGDCQPLWSRPTRQLLHPSTLRGLLYPNAAYAVVERYYADVCCSDDREYYRIESRDAPGEPALDANRA